MMALATRSCIFITRLGSRNRNFCSYVAKSRFANEQRYAFKLKNIVSLFFLIFILTSCSKHGDEDSYSLSKIKTVLSSAGHEAYIIEATLDDSSNTQVIVDFAGGKCGAGAVNSLGINLKLDIKWSDATTLVVSKPEQVQLMRNASGETLRCSESKVLVVIKNYKVSQDA